MEKIDNINKVENKGKSNKQFMILSAIGIVAIVLGHTGMQIDMLYQFFPYGSCMLSLFMFISGYFYKRENEEHPIKFLWKKAKKLLIPFFIWNILYGVISQILRNMGIIKFGEDVNLYTIFISPWLKNTQNGINFAAWFVPCLFLVNATYIFIRKITSHFKIFNEYILLAIFIAIGIAAVKMSHLVDESVYWITLLRIMFFIQIFHIGYLYRNKLEKYDVKINSVVYLLSLMMINIVLTKIYGKLNYVPHHFTGLNQENPLLPLIVSMTGILFWNRIARILTKSLGDSKIVNYISENTFSIMMHHMSFVLVFNIILYFIHNITGKLTNFNVARFQAGTLYTYAPVGLKQFAIIYTIIGIAGPLIAKYLYDKYLKKWIKFIYIKIRGGYLYEKK